MVGYHQTLTPVYWWVNGYLSLYNGDLCPPVFRSPLKVWKIYWTNKSFVQYTNFQMLKNTFLDHRQELYSLKSFGINLEVNYCQRVSRSITWVKPNTNSFKLNVACGGLGTTVGCGGVFRDHNGIYLLGFIGLIANGDVNYAFYYAILHGLILYANLHISNVVLEVGSYFDYNFINHKEDRIFPSSLFYIRRDIKDILNTLNCSFSIIVEDGNVCSQSIATLSYDLNGMTVLAFSQLPICVKRPI
ncbi:uncharacterized protein LOC114580818 isoform X2 [Dendrobium catenatum]|uniref:uncharacterized protein LOC114580818 isoform X2 n=1 Tax=Dendrobium catenatum TaxID=906689 RepID=UPI0010A013A2|nr:uncharacterized protein LOC114580818 isoform X2 [Dendrobium catenatum]